MVLRLVLEVDLEAELDGIRTLEVEEVGVGESADGEGSVELLGVSEAEDTAVVEAGLDSRGLIRLETDGGNNVDLAGLEIVDSLKAGKDVGG